MTAKYHVDTVGSFIRPPALLEAREKFQKGMITQEELTKVEDVEIKKLVEKQIATGLKIVNDGEFRRSSFNTDFYAAFKGIGFSKDFAKAGVMVNRKEYGDFFTKNAASFQFLTVLGKIEYNPNHPEFKAWEYLKSITPAGITAKWLIPSPTFPFVFTGLDFEKKWAAPYTDNKELLYADISNILDKFITHIYELGCRHIQIDEPTWFCYPSNFLPDEKQKEQLDYSQRYVECVTSVLLPIFKKKPADLEFTFHFCRGNSLSTWDVAPQYSSPFIVEAVKTLNPVGLLMEYDTPRCGTFDVLSQYTDVSQARIFVGTVCTKTTEVETEDYLESRIKEAAKYAPLDRLGITTQCGFCTAVGLPQNTSDDSQWKKLALMVKVATKLWGEA